MVDANPATRVRTVRGRTRAGPYQRLITVKAGWYSTAACAVPATSQAAKNTGRFGAVATMTRASTPTRDPPIISVRGPVLSRILPTKIPAAAETSSPAEKAPGHEGRVPAGVLADGADRRDQCVVEHAPPGRLGDAQRGEAAARCTLRDQCPG